jgi:hypothetical protein
MLQSIPLCRYLFAVYLLITAVLAIPSHVHRRHVDSLDGFSLANSSLAKRDDFACGPGNPCRNGACCGSGGFCGYGK